MLSGRGLCDGPITRPESPIECGVSGRFIITKEGYLRKAVLFPFTTNFLRNKLINCPR